MAASQPIGTAGDYRPRYVKGLDGLRGILILMVVLVHLDVLQPNYGLIAVNSFFVLSGFLITRLLVAEWNESGTISFRQFYWRRALRLFPALFTMLALFAIYTCVVNSPRRIALDFDYILQAAFYCTNWGQILGMGQRLNELAHTWSLSIEEQFYLLWPPVLLFLLRRTASKTSLLWWTLLAALGAAFLRLIYVELDFAGWSNYWRLARGLDTRADALLTGCCAGLILPAQLISGRRWVERLLMLAAALCVAGLYWLSRHDLYDPWMFRFGWLLASVFMAAVIMHLAFSAGTILHRVFEFYPLVYVGTVSYGLYVWHYPIFRIMRDHFPAQWQMIAVPATIAATLLSYYFIERPCLRLKQQFHRTKRPGRTISYA